jgi:hypothetical protein
MPYQGNWHSDSVVQSWETTALSVKARSIRVEAEVLRQEGEDGAPDRLQRCGGGAAHTS